MRLFIAEKPSMGAAIAKGLDESGKHFFRSEGCIYVGSDVVTWLFGHLLEQFSPEDYDEKYRNWHIEDLPIIPNPWKLKVKSSAKKQFKIVKELAQKADVIVNAGDPDREGQLLVDELLLHIGVWKKKKVERILLNALDEKSIRAALKKMRPNEEFDGLRQSALSRQRADWLIGMNLSRIYSIRAEKAGYSGGVSVGRVKTPTLGLVVRRELDICSFKPKAFFTPELVFRHPNGDFPAKWKKSERDGIDEEGRILERSLAEKILEDAKTPPLVIERIEQKAGKSAPRLPYSLSSLQVEAGKKTGFSPQKILDICQALYEKKLTTYPRSDCQHLPTNQWEEGKEILSHLAMQEDAFAAFAEKADPTLKSRAWNDSKVTAHHAIIPTKQKANYAELTQDEKIIYGMIGKAYIAQFYPPQEFLTTTAEIKGRNESYRASGKVIRAEGWKAIYAKDKAIDDGKKEEGEVTTLPQMQEGDTVEFAQGKIVEGKTTPPSRFTEATLVEAMKEIHKHVLDKNLAQTLKDCAGLGTEATRAGIIEELLRKNFFLKEKNFLKPTELSINICNILPEELLYPDLTAKWEDMLDKVGKNEMTGAEFQAGQQTILIELLDKAMHSEIAPPKNVQRCPHCNKPLKRRKSKKGTYFWGCTGYPECKALFDDEKGKPGREWKPKT